MAERIKYALAFPMLFLASRTALAYAPPPASGIPTTVSGGAGWTPASFTFGDIFGGIAGSFVVRAIIGGIALIVIARAALLLIVEQSESELSEFKKQMVSAMIAIVLIAIAGPISTALFGPSHDLLSDPSQAVYGIQKQLLGIIDFIEEPLAVIAVVMIIVSGVRAVLNWGGSDGLSDLKRTIISIFVGIFLIVAKGDFVDAFLIVHNPNPIINAIGRYLVIAMGFVTLIAVAVIIFAGFLMIVNVGKDEQYQRAKGIVIRVAIGLVVILASMSIAMVFLV